MLNLSLFTIMLWYNVVMDRNFKVRLSVGLSIFAIASLSLYLFEGAPFRFLVVCFILIAAIELLSFLKKKADFASVIFLLIELGFLYYGAIYVVQLDILHTWCIILGVPGYDVFAYFFGKMLGGKIIKKSRPFPHISKNKTWEGTFGGLIVSFILVLPLILACGNWSTDWIFLLCGPLALMGDLFESFVKRRFKIKDSNEIVIKNSFFEKLEVVVGGKDGHGGFLDRIDSSVFTATVLLVITSFM